MPSRRGHQKSRHGCQQCKTRRVKVRGPFYSATSRAKLFSFSWSILPSPTSCHYESNSRVRSTCPLLQTIPYRFQSFQTSSHDPMIASLGFVTNFGNTISVVALATFLKNLVSHSLEIVVALSSSRSQAVELLIR